MPFVRFTDETPPVEVNEGSPLPNALLQIRYKGIYWGCNEGVCGTCRFLPVSGKVQPPGGVETVLLEKVGAGPGERLACHVRVREDLTISPAPSVFKKKS